MSKRYSFGKWEETNQPMTVEDATRLCDLAEDRRAQMADYPLDRTLAVMDNLRSKWQNPTYPRRKAMAEVLPSLTGFSREMIEKGLAELSFVLNPDVLQKKIDTELRGITRQPGNTFSAQTGTALQWQPLGTLLHVLAGNVFLVGVGSWIEGAITGNINILKMPSAEKTFLPEFVESIRECDPDGVLSESLAVVDYSSSQKEIIQEFKNRMDGIVVWGGEAAVQGYRSDLPARTKLIVFGPKLSVAVVTQKGLQEKGADWVGEKLAQEIAIWDQNACTAPQVCYVEGKENLTAICEATAKASTALAATLPPGEIDGAAAAEIRKLRTIFEIAETRQEGVLREAENGLDWTVIGDKDQTLEPSPLHRTIRIIPFTERDEVLSQIQRLRGYIQTVGLATNPAERITWSTQLTQAGALRLLPLGQMGGGEIDDPHDGSYALPHFLNLHFTRYPESDQTNPVDFLPAKEYQRQIDSQLRVLIRQAKRAPFYANRLEGKKIESVTDLPQIPILTREEMESNMPPQGTGLATGDYTGGYVSRSGGSTGEPKFSIYDGHDWEEMISNAVRLFQAAGLKRGDRLANCMIAGDLYGSFVSFDHINCRLGVTNFAFATKVTPETFVDMWRKFNINAIQGLPTTIVPLLKQAMAIEPKLSLDTFIYAGSALSAGDYRYLKEHMQIPRVTSIIGANDGGQIAFQCNQMKGPIHHTVDDFNYIEIIDPNGQSVRDGNEGQIVITSLRKYAFPLIRYTIGDRGRIVPTACPCGRTNRVLEYLGRNDDVLPVGLLNIRFSDFQKALEDLPVSQIQLAAQNEERGEYLLVRVEAEDQDDGFRDKIYQTLMERIFNLSDRIQENALVKVEVELFSLGSLPRNARSAKVKGIVDERQ